MRLYNVKQAITPDGGLETALRQSRGGIWGSDKKDLGTEEQALEKKLVVLKIVMFLFYFGSLICKTIFGNHIHIGAKVSTRWEGRGGITITAFYNIHILLTRPAIYITTPP